MTTTVFYAWQSDSPGKVNRYLIRDALQEAIDRVGRELQIEDALALDMDTQGVPGSPEIANTILAKIKSCAVFVADVTYVGRTCPKRGKKPKSLKFR